MELVKQQLSLFFSTIYEGEYDDLSHNLKTILGKPVSIAIFPKLQNIEVDIPYLVMDYSTYKVNVSAKRIDFHLNPEFDLKLIKDKIDDFLLSFTFNRIGYVRTLYLESNNLSLKTLLSENLCSQAFDDISIRTNKKYKFKHLLVNNVQSVSPGIFQPPETKELKSGYLLIRDVNNAPIDKIDNQIFISVFENFIEKSMVLLYEVENA